MVKLIKKWWLSIIVSVVILVLSFGNFSSFNEMPKIKGEDKFIHILMYAALGFVIGYETLKEQIYIIIGLHSSFFILIYIALFGGLIEICQKYFFLPRTAEWIDWAADILGAIIGIFLLKFFYRKKNG